MSSLALRKLIEILQNGEFHSGEELGRMLGISRSAVWKLIKQLAFWDLEIEAVTNKGYRIVGGLQLLKKAEILDFLSTEQKKQLAEVEVFDQLPSTNDYLLHSIATRPKNNYVCFAEKQTQGRGRRGRSWISPFARNIYLSVLWRFAQDPSALSGLSLVVAIAIVETLKTYGINQDVRIKWPNDIICNHRKLAGILIDVVGESNDATSAVIGIGLNIQMPNQVSKEITQPWIDVQSLASKTINRNELAGLLLKHLINILQIFQDQGFKAFMQKWQTLDLALGKPISLITATATITGIGRGINEYGHFLVENEGNIKIFSSGEVSVRLN